MELRIEDIVTQLPSKGSNGTRPLRAIRYAIIHHDGVPVAGGYNHLDRYISQAHYHIGKGWRRLAYHIRIASDGTVYIVNRFQENAWHAGNLRVNKTGIGICLDGDLTKQKPTADQVGSLWRLLDYLTQRRPDMPLLVSKYVRPHSAVKLGFTRCPGNTVRSLINAYRT